MRALRSWKAPLALSCLTLAPLMGQADTWIAPGASGNYLIRNDTQGVTPFRIAASPDNGNTLFISAAGNLGLGANPPDDDLSARLYINDPTPELELNDSDNNRTWQIYADGGDGGSDIGEIAFADVTAQTIPFSVQSEAPTDSLRVTSNGDVGIGLFEPQAKFHVKDVSNGKILVENTPALAASGELFEIKNNGGMSFQMTNTNANPVSTWKFVAATQGNAPGGADSFRISKIGFGPPIFQIFDTGDAILRGSLTTNSDVNTKQDIEAINPESILAKVMDLPISEWSYKTSPSSRHIGPMAQDFYRAFQLGHTDKGISSIDTGGVALAAIQALTVQLREKDERVQSLGEKNQALQAQLLEQDIRVQQLELAVTELLNKISPEEKIGSVN